MKDDTISRKAVMESLTKEYNRRFKEGGLKLAWIEKAVNETPTAQPVDKDTNVPSNDCISRQAALDALDEIESEVADGYGYQYEKWRKYFCGLPSAQPEIIRCKDCAKHEYCRTSTVWAIPPKDDWYCADAERRTDG